MKKCIFYVCLITIFIILTLNAFAQTGTGAPLKYISSCEIDLNNDNEPDIVLLVETIKGQELIILMRKAGGYNAFIVSKVTPGMVLSCHFGKNVCETKAGKGNRKGKVYKTPGTYIKLSQPESSSVVYFWNNNTFQKVWTSD